MNADEDLLTAQATPPLPPRRRSLPLLGLLVLGGLGGFALGHLSLERAWSSPLLTITPDQARSASAPGADPTPSAGSRVLRPMPLARTRQELASLTRDDPVQVVIGSLGRGDGMSVTLRLLNRGTCEVTSVEGVAYGFDAWNHPASLNLGHEHHVAFRLDQLSLPPGGHQQPDFPLKHPDTASIVVGHVDAVQCADGTRWRRPR